jgi:hypothetical protein
MFGMQVQSQPLLTMITGGRGEGGYENLLYLKGGGMKKIF